MQEQTASVFDAFADSAKKRRWFAEGEQHDIEEFEMDFRVGGAERLRYRFKESTRFKGVVTMTLADKRISASLVTIEFLPTDKGTDLICTHQGTFFEGADGPQMREGGWRSLFEQLA